MRLFSLFLSSSLLFLVYSNCTKDRIDYLQVHQGDHLILLGNNLCSRMMNFGHFETGIQLAFADSMLTIRNLCDGGDTPGFRPHPGRKDPWPFPGADKFQSELSKNTGSEGHFEYPDAWMTRLQADILVAFFGYNESFNGPAGLENFKGELEAFILHTLQQKYNGQTPPQLALVSPIAFQDLSDRFDLPDGQTENQNLSLYTEAMREVAVRHGILFIDVFTPSRKWFSRGEPLTQDGFQLNDAGYQKLARVLISGLFGRKIPESAHQDRVNQAVLEKNWFWHNDYKIPNGVHVFGRRYDPFGPDNYPAELEKIRQMTAIRDTAIWWVIKGQTFNLAEADARTRVLPAVETNYQPSEKNGTIRYLYGSEALATFKTAPGYRIELFASEKEFPDLANPVQIAFDNQGRLWVATMPSYPHYRPGDARPDDKIIILEDTDGNGQADRQITFARGLHLPTGFEFAPEGVYVAQGTNLVLLTDTNGDDQADQKEIILSGFDDHDTHHVISAFCADPSGAIYMGEGVFLHSNVETAYGPVRATNGGFMRYNPQRRHLERTAQVSIPNPWGIAFDDWGQNFFLETSGPAMRWMLPGSIKPRYGVANPKSFDLIQESQRVRPTSGLEFVSSRHFPENVQGDLLLCNTIGFLGIKQHIFSDSSTGYKTTLRHDLLQSTDKNFRPADLEFAPDGSLYLADWHNVLIGHMQHNARDPLRDHVHGRIYRITYPSRPLVQPASVAGASISELLNNLTLPEYRTRYRSRRELRAKPVGEVLPALKTWIKGLDNQSPRYEHHLLEALWVSWGINQVDQDLLKRLLKAQDFRVRAAATRVLRYTGHQLKDQPQLLMQMVQDSHGRVRMEAFVAATWLKPDVGLPIVREAAKYPLDEWMVHTHEAALAHLQGKSVVEKREEDVKTDLTGQDREMFKKGKAIYAREGFCMTCHQGEGEGLDPSGFPPLANSSWVTGSPERLIKLTLKGLIGPIEVNGKVYPGHVPMTPFEGLLKDDEIAAVLTYVRNTFGNKASVITPEQVARVREEISRKKGFYRAEELLGKLQAQ